MLKRSEYKLRQLLRKTLDDCASSGFVWPEYQLTQLIKHTPDISIHGILYDRVQDAYENWCMRRYDMCKEDLQKTINVLS